MPTPIPIGGGGPPSNPGLTCAQAKAQIASLTLTVANLKSLLARTQDPVQRADIQAGINEGQQEITALRQELPLLCAPPPPPVNPVPVLVVLDSDGNTQVSFTGLVSQSDSYFTISHFLSVLESAGQTNPLMPVTLTLAHRQTDPSIVNSQTNPAAAAKMPPGVINQAYFTWQSSTAPAGKTAVDLSAFEVVFLFGAARLSNPAEAGVSHLAWDGGDGEAQLWAFFQYMNSGRGLFATGDHEDLGASMCAAIPRVRSMRRWLWAPGPTTATYGANYVNNVPLIHFFNQVPYDDLGMICAPPALGPDRHDTLQPLPSGLETVVVGGVSETGIPFDRQSDDIPQPITVTTPHPTLDVGPGQLAVFPDHMHEGMTVDLSDTIGVVSVASGQTVPDPRSLTYPKVDPATQQTTPVPEYPSGANGQPLPQKLVQETVIPGHETPSTEPEHVNETSPTAPGPTGSPVVFGGSSAYDGTPAGVGRIIVDATFHHFFDINLIGDPVAKATLPAGDGRGSGFTTLAGQQYLAQFSQYWLNLVNWLSLPALGQVQLLAAVEHARQSSAIRMAAGPGVAEHGEAVHDLGEMVVQFLERYVPATLLRDAMQHALPTIHAAGMADWLTARRAERPEVADAADRVLLHGFMGGALLHGLTLPREQNLVTDAESVAEQLVRAGLLGAAKALSASPHGDRAADLIALLAGKVRA